MPELTTKTLDQIRRDILGTYRQALIAEGISDPDVSKGTEIYAKATAFAQQILSITAVALALSEGTMPDTATGEDLERLCAVYGITRQGSKVSVGLMELDSTGSVLVPTDYELVDEDGALYRVSSGGTFADGDSISIESAEGGAAKNIANGSVLRWKIVPAGAQATATVIGDGLTGGAEAETDALLRARLFAFLRTAPGNGNWTHLKELAEASSSDVQAYVYQAHNGPATVAVAVCRAPTETDKGRDVDSTLLTGTIAPYVEGLYPAHCELTVTTVTNVETDVAIGLSLDEQDGWIDDEPWPTYASAVGYCAVVGATSSTNFDVYSESEPSANMNHIVWIDPSDFTLYRSKVTAYEFGGQIGGYDTWTVSIDQPFPGIAAGDFIFPDCTHAEEYRDTVMAIFADMGPGELVSAAGLLPRAYRRPRQTEANPSSFGAKAIAKFRDDTLAPRVEDFQYLYRSTTTPALPTLVTDAPNILTPRKIAFYKLED